MVNWSFSLSIFLFQKAREIEYKQTTVRTSAIGSN